MDLSVPIIISIFVAMVRMMVPVAFTAIGEVFAERSGVLNLGLEGMMVMGSISGFMAAYFTGNLWLGILAGILAGGLIGLVMAIMSIKLFVDQVVAGITISILCLGLSAFLFRITFGIGSTPPTVEGFQPVLIPILSEIPVLGSILFRHNIFIYIAFLIVPISTLILFKTTLGLRIRSVGENPRAADILGINVYRIRYLCVIFSGMMAGLGGAYLSLAEIRLFSEGMSAGRGYMAIALVIFGKWTPSRVFLGCLLFSFIDGTQLRLQTIGAPVPYQFLVMLPYVVTIIIIAVAYKRAGAPAALTIPYERS